MKQKTIWKFPLKTVGVQTIQMPLFSEILTVQEQFNEPMMWALVDPEQSERVPRTFEMVGTGHGMHDNYVRKYIGTYQMDAGNYVFHVFELLSKVNPTGIPVPQSHVQ